MRALFPVLILILISGCQRQALNCPPKIAQIHSIQKIPDGEELKADSLYWDIVRCGKEAIPQLLSLLDDSTKTAAKVLYFGGNYTVADISYNILNEIIHGIPTLKFIKTWNNFDKSAGYGNYWYFVRESFENRKKFKKLVSSWYRENESNMIWNSDSSMHIWQETKPRIKHPAGGHYTIK